MPILPSPRPRFRARVIAWTLVIEPRVVEVMRSCSSPISVARVG